jgi:hypothetical protein
MAHATLQEYGVRHWRTVLVQQHTQARVVSCMQDSHITYPGTALMLWLDLVI